MYISPNFIPGALPKRQGLVYAREGWQYGKTASFSCLKHNWLIYSKKYSRKPRETFPSTGLTIPTLELSNPK